MQSSPDQPSSGAWLGLPPDEKRPVSRGARYRCIFLMLLYWAVLSAIPQGADRLAEIGTNLPLWMGALELTPFLLVPAFLFLAVRTGAQWRALMITVYAGLFLNLLMNMALPSGAMWGDLPAAGPYGTRVWPGGDHREWLVTLPRFPQFWALVIYVFLSGSGTPPLLRLLALAWWFLLCVAPVNTGMVGYADILGPLVIIALVLGCMHLAEKRASRQTGQAIPRKKQPPQGRRTPPGGKLPDAIRYFQITSKIFTELPFFPVRPRAFTGFLTDFRLNVLTFLPLARLPTGTHRPSAPQASTEASFPSDRTMTEPARGKSQGISALSGDSSTWRNVARLKSPAAPLSADFPPLLARFSRNSSRVTSCGEEEAFNSLMPLITPPISAEPSSFNGTSAQDFPSMEMNNLAHFISGVFKLTEADSTDAPAGI